MAISASTDQSIPLSGSEASVVVSPELAGEPAGGFFSRLWQAWTRFANALGRILTTVWMVVVYSLVLPFFQFRRLADPLQKRLLSDQKSYWEDRAKREPAAAIERLAQPF